VRARLRGEQGRKPGSGTRMARLTFTRPPVDLAFYGVFWSGPRRCKCSVAAPAHAERTIDIDLSHFEGDGPFRLELRPSITVASRTVAIERIWNGELRWTNLSPVRAAQAGGQAASAAR